MPGIELVFPDVKGFHHSRTPRFKITCAPARRPVRCLAVDAGNEWFVTGSADRTIKIWDLATGQLRLTLTGHIEQARNLPLSRNS